MSTILSIASIPSYAAMSVRETLTPRNAAIAAARAVHFSRVYILPTAKAGAIVALALVALVVIIALNFLLTAETPENSTSVKEISETPETSTSEKTFSELPELFKEAEEMSKKPIYFGETIVSENLTALKVSELRKLAQQRNIPQARNARKAELIAKLEELRICEV